jgi:hypothetical protein
VSCYVVIPATLLRTPIAEPSTMESVAP